jgi:exonuclease SbcD
LAAHVHVHGGSIGKYSLFRLSEQDDIIVEGTALAERFAYVALGHIHKPQTLGAENIRYSGSIEKMDLGETNDSKGVVIVDLGRTGQLREITTLPLPSTPVYEIMVRDPAEDIPRLRQDYPEAHDDLVNLHITYTAGKHILEDVLRELEGIFPRWYARDWQEQHQLLAVSLADGAFDRSKSFAETVREYLQQELVQHPDAERDAILALAEELISECDETEQ